MHTNTRTITGMRFDGENLEPVPITVRISTDERGSTLSLSDDQSLMLQIDCGDIEDMLRLCMG